MQLESSVMQQILYRNHVSVSNHWVDLQISGGHVTGIQHGEFIAISPWAETKDLLYRVRDFPI